MALKRPTGETLADLVKARTGHSFRDVRLLETALTHSSAVRASSNNQRLEFLGDRVLGLIVADLLFEKFPEAPEGEIAPRFNALVDARTCSEIGIEMQLEDLVRADAALKARSRGSGGNYLADAVEALIGATYLSEGADEATAMVLRLIAPLLADPDRFGASMDPKTSLQELSTRLGKGLPQYAVTDSGPDHSKRFHATVLLAGDAIAEGDGTSKKQAEMAAALSAWAILQRPKR